MASLGITVRGYKVGAAWIGEKIGQLKFNGRLSGRSPLSDLEELELLWLGVEGKVAGWRTLRTLADTDPRLDAGRLDELIAGARSQAGQLEELRIRAASRVISDGSAPAPAALDRAVDRREPPGGQDGPSRTWMLPGPSRSSVCVQVWPGQ